MKKLLIVCCAVAFAAASMTTGAVEKKVKRKAPRRVEHLMCQLGTEDRQARIAVETVNGAIQNFAYYSKWEDNGRFTKVTTEKGIFLIENARKNIHFIFKDVERERYCGADGKINGTLTIWRGRSKCDIEGVLDNDPNEIPGDTKAEAAPERPAPELSTAQR